MRPGHQTKHEPLTVGLHAYGGYQLIPTVTNRSGEHIETQYVSHCTARIDFLGSAVSDQEQASEQISTPSRQCFGLSRADYLYRCTTRNNMRPSCYARIQATATFVGGTSADCGTKEDQAVHVSASTTR